MAIERQPVAGLQRVQATGAPRMAGTSAIQVGTPNASDYSQGSKFVDDLFSAANSLAVVGTHIMNQAIEDDKVIQYDRALQGLMPTEDATVGGARANMLMKMQLEANNETQRLADLATRFEGTDEEWEQTVVMSRNNIQDRIMSDYPELAGNKQTMKEVTNVFMEQQPKIFASRQTAKLQRQQQDRISTLQGRLATTSDPSLTPEAQAEAMDSAIQAGLLSGLTLDQAQKVAVDQAMELARIGQTNAALGLQYIKDANGVSLYDKDPAVRAAIMGGDAERMRQNIAETFTTVEDLESAFMSGDIDVNGLLQSAQELNNASGHSMISQGMLRSWIDAREKAAGDMAANQDMMKLITDPNRVIGAMGFSEKQKKGYAEAIVSWADEAAATEIRNTGIDPASDQAEAIRFKYQHERIRMLNRHALEDPTLKARVDGMYSMVSAQHFGEDGKTVAPEIEATYALFKQMPPESRKVLGDEQQTFMENVDYMVEQGQTLAQAIQGANRARNHFNVDAKAREKISNATDNALEKVGGQGWFDFKDAVSDMGMDILRDEAGKMVNLWISQGMKDPDRIEKRLVAELESKYRAVEESKQNSGFFMKGDTSGIPAMLKTAGKSVNPRDVQPILGQYMDEALPQLEKRLPSHLTKEDIWIDYNEKTGNMVIKAGSEALPISGIIPITSLDTGKLMQDYYGKAEEKRAKGEPIRPSGLTGDLSVPEPKNWSAKDVGSRSLTDFIMSKAFAKGQNLPANFEWNHEANMDKFYADLARTENGNKVGFNRASGVYSPYKDAHGESVGYGHFLTPEEKRTGFIMIDGERVPYRRGESQLTEERAMKLMKQDVKSHVPGTRDWKIPFDQMHPAQQRGLMDLTYNLGKGGISSSPRALAAFKAGRLTDGFIEMLSTASSEGKREPGLLKRRAEAYNMASAGAAPKISEIDTRADGSMYVKFDGEMPASTVSAWTRKRISKDGWYKVYDAAPTKLAKGATIGRTKL